MLDSTLLTVLINTGVAGVFCILFLIGWVYPRNVVMDLRKEVTELKETLQKERERADAAVSVAEATKDVLIAITYRRDKDGGEPLPLPRGRT